MKRLAGLAPALTLFALLIALLAPASASAVYTQQQCIDCHTSFTPGVVTQFNNGVMSTKGVTCIDCHGDDHTAINTSGGNVPASVCARCHPAQYAEFTAKDGNGVYINKHALGWTKMTAGARYQVMPAAERYSMCERCHNVGEIASDGSIGKCDSCHTRHTFSADEAREPAACGTCHMGPDHEQIDMWEKSKHGVAYTTEKDRPGGDPTRAPSCVTCHMPESTNGVGQPLVHNVSQGITYGTTSQGAAMTGVPQPVPMRTMTASQFTTNRAQMVDVCSQCHSAGFAEDNLTNADTIKQDVDAKLWDPIMRIRGLSYDGLLDPMPADREPNPIYGNVLVVGGQQLYSGTSAIEQMFFSMYKYDHVTTFKGAYHMNPDYTHWFGWARINSDLDLIKGEESNLRHRPETYDAGFSASARATVGVPVVLDATALETWGNASANTFSWYFGDTGKSLGETDTTTEHTYAAAGAYPVQLTVSDTDLVNNVSLPTLNSAKRTTTLSVTVKNSAALTLKTPAATRKGAAVKVGGTLTTGGSANGAVTLWRRVGSGPWTSVASKPVTTVAATPLAVSFKITASKPYKLKLIWSGDSATWDATSPIRSLRLL